MGYEFFLLPFIVSFLIAAALLAAIVFGAGKIKIPDGRLSSRHVHKKGVSRFGGAALILSFMIALIIDRRLALNIPLVAVLAACAAILLFGIIDDLKQLSWKSQLFFQIIMVIAIYVVGVRLQYVTNPFGGIFLFEGAVGYALGLLVSVVWIVLLMNAVNWVDGVDGVSGGITLIGAVTLFFLSLRPEVNQPPLGIIAAALTGSLLAFLIFNFHPAKIMAGTSGSMFMGFILAVLAIFAGAKIATTILVMAVPILDACWVIIRRLRSGDSVFLADKRHMHFKLLESDWSVEKICFFYFGISAVVAWVALNTQASGKLLSFIAIAIAMSLFLYFIHKEAEIEISINHSLFSKSALMKKIAVLLVLLLVLFFSSHFFLTRVYSPCGNWITQINVGNKKFFAETVSNDERLRKGLGGRGGLCQSCAMLFKFSQPGRYAFWMKDMRFPLDIVWIRGGEVVHMEKNVSPDSTDILVPDRDADSVLEINAGIADKTSLQVGDAVVF